jgi:periplasmic divalent cation tolerance protein
MTENKEIVVVLATVPSYDVGKAIARELVAKNLAACVNILPALESVYEWEGRVEESSEALLVIKTTKGSLESLTSELVKAHPYDLPEVIALPVIGGHAPYMEWVRSMTESKRTLEDPRP